MAAVKSSALSDSSSDDERSHRSSFNIPQKIGIQVSVIQENHGAKRVAQSETSNVIKYPPKKRKIENAPESSGPKYSNISKNIMEKMGYKDGLGLGKHEQGRVNIVEASQQKGRRGLGLRLPNLEMSGKDWDFEKEEVVVEETVNWMPECSETPPTIKEMRQWMQEGPKKLTIDNETEFCGQEILQRVLKNKSVFDMLMAEEMRGARTRSNPYETIRGGIFLNRAAMKMANMDCVFDFMFTSPKTENADEVLKPLDLLYFADLCSGPGGFSEYVLWRKKWDTKGFGFTLRGANDFKLEDFFSGPCEPFEPHYGVNGKEGDGDIFVEENLRNFRKFVLESTDNTGVHFVMADGGFSVEGQENIQEILSKQLYLCQFLCALGILRDGGHFVCKVFDLFTPFSVGLVYLLYRAFKKVCIHKPVTSRPANSERYVVCKWYRKDEAKDIRDYLFEVNCELNRMKGVTSNKDIVQVVPLELMRKDPEFCDYITQSNEFLAEYQVLHLQKIQVFVQNTGLHEDRQSEVRKQCLQLWKVPDNVRSAPLRSDPANKALDILQVERSGMPSQSTNVLNLKGLTNIKGIYDYYCVVSAFRTENRSNRTLILGLGRKHVYKWETGSGSRKWTKMELNIEIPDDTLLLAEEVQELRGEGKAQKKMTALHVIDAAKLGGKDVSKLSYIERIEWIKKFLKAIAKPSRPDVAAIRMKEIFRLDSLESIFDRLSEHCVKGQRGMPRLCYSCDNEKYFVPYGVLLFRVTVDPWIAAFSQRNQKVYYFNTKSKESSYEFPNEAVASFSAFFKNFIFWEWTDGVEASISGNMKDASKVSKDAFMDFIIEKLKAAA